MIPDANFTLVAAKSHLRIEHSHEDALVTAYLQQAVSRVEHDTGLSLHSHDEHWEISLANHDDLRVPLFFPLSPVTGYLVGYRTAAGVTVPFPSAMVRKVWLPAQGEALIFDRLPDDHDASAPGVSVDYQVDGPVHLPQAVKAAVYLILGDLYANRESGFLGSGTYSINPALEALVAPHRRTVTS